MRMAVGLLAGRPFHTVLDRGRRAAPTADGPRRRAAAGHGRPRRRPRRRASTRRSPCAAARSSGAATSWPCAERPGEDGAAARRAAGRRASPRSSSRRRAATTASGSSPRWARPSPGPDATTVQVARGHAAPVRARRARRRRPPRRSSSSPRSITPGVRARRRGRRARTRPGWGSSTCSRRMGADVTVDVREERLGEPVGELTVRAAPLHGAEVTVGDEVPNRRGAGARRRGRVRRRGHRVPRRRPSCG